MVCAAILLKYFENQFDVTKKIREQSLKKKSAGSKV
jgi:hypothetical protein